MIQTVKRNEQLRKEYHVLPAALMDALGEGVHQKAFETAKNLLELGLSRENIAQATGLTRAEVETIS